MSESFDLSAELIEDMKGVDLDPTTMQYFIRHLKTVGNITESDASTLEEIEDIVGMMEI